MGRMVKIISIILLGTALMTVSAAVSAEPRGGKSWSRGGHGGGHNRGWSGGHNRGGYSGWGRGWGRGYSDPGTAFWGGVVGGLVGGIFAPREPEVVVVPERSIEWCIQRYRSYDTYTKTYLGFDGLRHGCP